VAINVLSVLLDRGPLSTVRLDAPDPAIGGGFCGVGPGIARVGPAFRVAGFRRAGWAPGWGWRRGWGGPVAFGLGLGAAWGYPYYASYYSDPCVVWNGYASINVCYPYSYY
jgi:hypothetical protein